MELDNLFKESIRNVCAENDCSQSAQPLIRLIERYIANELNETELMIQIQSIYDSFRG